MKIFRFVLKAISLILLVSVISACGGGGGGSSQDSTPIQLNSGTSASSTVAVAKSSLQFSETSVVTATFKQADGSPAVGKSVNFSSTLGTLTPANGIAITDANGIATVQLTAGAASGQGQITASTTIENKQVTRSGLFSINLPQLTLSPMTLGVVPPLSYGGSTSVSVTVRDANGATFSAQEVDVVFTSTQSALGKASISTPVRTVNGVATATYKATTATGNDTITASISGSSVTANISVTPLNAGSITYLSASPTNITLKGMGGLGSQETSTVTFRVFDTSGQVKANQQVDFALNTYVGGMTLSQSSGSTGTDGTVSTIVQAGTVATPVRVTATVRGSSPAISTQSDQLVVSTGVPTQDGFSVSIGNMNPECWTIDGVTTSVTARLSDHFHNPVPDGTAVSFTTSGGSIQPSCTTVNGTCSVTWTSQNPRPTIARGASKDGRVAILAYAVGEESFLDLNGNGLADAADTLSDDSEAFRDDNEDNVRQSTETFIDFNSSGGFDAGDGKYNGVLQGAVFSGVAKSKHVFSNSVIVMASSDASITNSCASPKAIASGAAGSCTITVAGKNGNTMPSGTIVEFSLSAVQSCSSVLPNACSFSIIDPPAAIVFPQSIDSTGSAISVTISNATLTGVTAKSNLIVKVTSPSGVVTSETYPIN